MSLILSKARNQWWRAWLKKTSRELGRAADIYRDLAQVEEDLETRAAYMDISASLESAKESIDTAVMILYRLVE